MLKRILITCLIALFGLACTRGAFVQKGRSTILAIEGAVDVMDETVTAHYEDAPLDDLEADKEIEAWDKAIQTVDKVLLFGWKKLYFIENGPPKMKTGTLLEWADWLIEIGQSLMVLVDLAELYGLDASPLNAAWDALTEWKDAQDD